MSYDFDTMPSACDHYQTMERVIVDPGDFVTLNSLQTGQRMRAPINGKNTFKLKFNGILVPQDHQQYGYIILDDELSVAPDKKSKVVFNNPVRLNDVLMEVEYVTIRSYCRKCNGKGQVTDLIKANSGSFKRTTEKRKLVQKALKFILTSKCVFYPLYTCALKTYVGKKFGTASLGPEDLSYDITKALTNMKKVQDAQGQIQRLEPLEILRDIKNIDVQRSTSDPTVVTIDLDLLTYSGDRAKTAFGLRVN